MYEILQTIALICQLHSAAPLVSIEQRQLACQVYFVRCTTTLPMKTLNACIMEREGTL